MRWIFIFHLNYTTAINRYEIYHKKMIFGDRKELETHARKVTTRGLPMGTASPTPMLGGPLSVPLILYRFSRPFHTLPR
jgi:hypothetical protein